MVAHFDGSGGTLRRNRRNDMAYAIVMVVTLSAGALAYVLTLRWSSPRGEEGSGFESGSVPVPAVNPSGMTEAVDGSSWSSSVSSLRIGDARVSWQSRAIGVLGLIALALVGALTVAISMYQGVSMLWKLFLTKVHVSPG
jgi:hypothetical protein